MQASTPLHFACHHNSREIAELLLQHKANIEVEDNADWTPLVYACISNDVDLVKYMLSCKADIKATAEIVSVVS